MDFGANSQEQLTPSDQNLSSLKTSEDFSVQQPIATWNTVRGAWETDQGNLLCEHLGLFSETWPTSGMTLNGRVFGLPTLEHRTNVSESLLLPTPNTMEHREIKSPEQIAALKEKSPGGYRNLREIVINEMDEDVLLRTPQAWEGQGGAIPADVKEERGNHIMVRDQMLQLAMENGLQVSEGATNLLPTVMANSPMRNSRRAMVTHPDKRSGVALNQALEIMQGVLPKEFESWDEVPASLLPTPRGQNGEDRNNKIWERDPSQPQNLENALFVTLPTPTVSDSKGAAKSEVLEGNPHHRLKVEVELFPTIVASEGVKATTAQGSEQKGETGQVWLTNIAHDLATDNGLPTPAGLLGTPRTSSANGLSSKQVVAGATKSRLEDQVECARIGVIAWGKFEPAIRRWEQVIGRPAPNPTNPDGKEGSHRLAPEFTEWMMGLPAGWITDAGLTRNEALKACGNGVVPQQAELALRQLLTGMDFSVGGGLTVLPTPTTMDKRDGSTLRSVAVKNLENGKNKGIGLNHLVEGIGVDWQDGDTFTMTDEGLKKNG